MQETILLAPGANNTEFIRTLAKFGKNTIGLRIMNAGELAKYALMHSGIVMKGTFLPGKQEASIIDSFVREIPYFQSASYADSKQIAEAIYSMRSLIPNAESETIRETFTKGEFPEKNQAIARVYERYLALLRKEELIDRIALIRRSIQDAAPLSCELITLEEFPISPLEQALVRTVATNHHPMTIKQLLGVTSDAPCRYRNIDYTESYGKMNEIESILAYILQNQIPLDQCCIAVTDAKEYAQLFYDYAQTYEMNITLGCGVPILNGNPAKLLKLFYTWNTTGYNGVDALKVLLESAAIDRKKLQEKLGISQKRDWEDLIVRAGNLRIGCDPAYNRTVIDACHREDKALLRALAGEFEQGAGKFIEKYSIIRTDFAGRIDRSALSVVRESLEAYLRFNQGGSVDGVIPEILGKMVCSENSKEGALYITSISGALCAMRPHLFVAGLSATLFPGAPKENYLLLDRDYLLLQEESKAPTSANKIHWNKENLHHLLNLATALNVSVHLSYSAYNLADLKMENPSSVLFEIYKCQHGNHVTMDAMKQSMRKIGFFTQPISRVHPIGQAYVKDERVLYTAPAQTGRIRPVGVDKSFPPTAIEMFFACGYKFFLTRILKLQEPEEDNPFEVISAAELGTMAHKLMELKGAQPYTKEVFLQEARCLFRAFLQDRPPIHEDQAAREENNFVRMMKYAFETDPGNKLVAAETEITVTHPSGIQIHGFPDRVEQDQNGNYLIADYKTGGRIRHQQDDLNTCLQVVLYAYMCHQINIPVSYCEYRYLRYGQTISCKYDDQMEAMLNEKMERFRTALETGRFDANGEGDTCKWCAFKGLCPNYQNHASWEEEDGE